MNPNVNKSVSVTKVIKKMQLENLTREINTDKILIDHAEVNRPALQLSGFYDFFDKERVQIIGKVENAYMQTKTPEERKRLMISFSVTRCPAVFSPVGSSRRSM